MLKVLLGSRGDLTALLLLLALLLTLGLSLVWLNIERWDLAYRIEHQEQELENKTALVAKLEVERSNLLSPQRIREMAQQFGLAQAKSGQIRHVEAGQ
ncbi:hypothetical protein dsx2_1564 [Desulfovibrio sp. X2]|uniref:hypothetical protein n=1 Tax=Desulfovibrio sp. X2 TaxID=941449 RepID=UPI000358A60D|nr:hypothetical protein [Desulfovibrio sp. X2]EPR44455.1 hypothetical protein dsx2_1564 [Desulfovibrio sp. X2]